MSKSVVWLMATLFLSGCVYTYHSKTTDKTTKKVITIRKIEEKKVILVYPEEPIPTVDP